MMVWKSQLKAVIAAGVILGGAAGACASSIAVNFGGNDLAVTDVTGVVPQSRWYNADPAAGTAPAGSFTDSTGSASRVAGVSMTWNSNNIYNDSADTSTPTGALFRNFLDGGTNSAAATVTISGLPVNSGGYTVYLYCASNHGSGDSQISDFAVNSVVQNNISQDTSGSTTFVQATSGGGAGNYVKFTGVSGPTISIVVNDPAIAHFRSSLDGFQIDGIPTPEPTSLTLLGLTGLGLLARRRRA